MTPHGDPLGNDLAPGVKEAREELRRLRLLWAFGCTTPLIYLLVAHGVDLAWFRKSGAGLLTLSVAGHAYVSAAFAAVGVILAAIVATLRILPVRRASDAKPGLAAAAGAFRRRVVVMVALSDLTACLGLVHFLLAADLRAVLVGGVMAYLLYAVSHPSRAFFARAAKLL